MTAPAVSRALPLLVAGAVVLLSVAGALLGLGVLRAGASEAQGPPLPAGPFATGEELPTSFGSVSVAHADKVAGPTSKALAGVTHGIAGLVPPNRVGVQVAVTISNLLDRPVDYEPTQFRLLVGKEHRPVRKMKSNLLPGTLQPGARIDGRVVFVAPRDGSKLWVEYADPGRDEPVLVDLGRVGRTPPGAMDRYHDHG